MNIPKIIPRKDQILVRPDEDVSRETESGILRPDTEEMEKKSIGTVIEQGPDVKDSLVNKKVIYGAYAGDQLNFSEDPKHIDFVLLKDEDVLAIIEDETV